MALSMQHGFFFGKSVSELTLEEVAMIAGIPRGPTVYSPYRNFDRTLNRRNHVLRRMYEEGYISNQVMEETQAKPMVASSRNGNATWK